MRYEYLYAIFYDTVEIPDNAIGVTIDGYRDDRRIVRWLQPIEEQSEGPS